MAKLFRWQKAIILTSFGLVIVTLGTIWTIQTERRHSKLESRIVAIGGSVKRYNSPCLLDVFGGGVRPKGRIQMAGFYRQTISTESISILKEVSSLQSLGFSECQFESPNVLQELLQLTQVRDLVVHDCNISDGDLEIFGKMVWLGFLGFDSVPISDSGATHLYRLDNLNVLQIQGSCISSAGAETLQRELPTTSVQVVESIDDCQ